MSLQYFIALEIANERVREAEARARLRWGMEPEPPVGRRTIDRLANLRRALSRTAASRDDQGGALDGSTTQPSGTAPA